MSILYEPFRDEDAISAALDRYWDEARNALMLEGDRYQDEARIAERALEIAKEKSRD